MGPGPTVIRAVLDTNVFISAVLFSGQVAGLVPAWQAKRFAFLVSRPLLDEYLQVLSYPKFRLNLDEIQAILDEEILPFVEVVAPRRKITVVRRDPSDNKFLECAQAGRAAYIVSGDNDLLSMQAYRRIRIVSAAEFLRILHRSKPR